MPLRLNKRDGMFFLLAGVLVSLYVLRAGGGFPLDDSWIHQTYARNLALRGEWAFVPGVPSAASTSPLYTVLLAIGYRIGIPYALWTPLLGVLALTGIAALGARMAERLLPDQRRAPAVTGAALLLCWHLIWAASSGMETALFSLLALLLLWLACVQSDRMAQRSAGQVGADGALFGIAAALAALARPEGVLAAGLAGLALLVARGRQHPRVVVWWMITAALGFGLTIAPYLLLNLRLTGGLLPDTANAKFVQHAPLTELPYLTRFYKLAEAILAGGQILLVPGMVALCWMKWKRTVRHEYLLTVLPLLWSVGLIALYAARLPAWYQHGRYVIPALPALVICGVVGMLWLLEQSSRRGKGLLQRVGWRALMLSTVLLFGIFAVWGMEILRTDVMIIDSEMVAAARWIAENLPEDELLAIHDIGAVGYFAPRPLLDIAGLISPEIVNLLHDPEQIWAAMRERDARYLMAFDDQIPGDDPADARLCEVFSSNAEITIRAGGSNMKVYRLAWDATCDD